MNHDPIVDEVRAIREQLAAHWNFDIRKIVEDAQRRQATSKFRIVSFERNKALGPANPVAGSGASHYAGPAGEVTDKSYEPEA